LLHNLVSKKGYQVINGGVGGYTSSQELLKLITEVRRLKNVELIISLNGINETPSYPGGKIYDINTKYPFLRLVQYQMLQSQRWIDQRVTFYGTSVWLPNIKSFIRFITEDSISEVDILMAKDTNLDKNYNDGLKYKYIDASERWLSNIKSMHAVSNNLGINYMVFLQPTMGVSGPQSLMPLNTESPDAIMLNELFENEKEYISEINNLYNKLRQYCSELDYCIDISNIAPPMINNYNDYRHHNENGNKIIAEEVAKNINNFSQ
jgi:lysophospholipase L1-like esterase